MNPNDLSYWNNSAKSNFSRRELLQGGIAASWGMLLSSVTPGDSAAAQTSHEKGWIDAHSHIWSRDIHRFPLVPGQTLDDLSPSSFTSEELLDAAQPIGVTRVVLIQHDVYHAFDNTYLIHEARRFPETFRVVGKVDDTKPHPDRLMRQLFKQHVTSFRITPRLGDNWLKGSGMVAMWKCAADTRQAIGCLIDAEHLASVDAMCEQHPDTPVVIDHFARIGIDGNIREKDVNQLCRLARHPYTYVKLSAYYALGAKKPPHDELIPMIRRLFETFGPQRLMWASDAPYQLQGINNYADSLALIRDRIHSLTDEDRVWLLRKTAENVYHF